MPTLWKEFHYHYDYDFKGETRILVNFAEVRYISAGADGRCIVTFFDNITCLTLQESYEEIKTFLQQGEAP